MGAWWRPPPAAPKLTLPQWLLKALGPSSAAARKAAMVPWSAQALQEGCANDRLAVNAGSIFTSAMAPSHCTCILSFARMHCVGIVVAWTTAAPVLVPTLPNHPWARVSSFGIANRTKVLIQERCRRQVSRQGVVRGQGLQTGFKIGGCCKTGGKRQGGLSSNKPPVLCKDTGCNEKKWPKRKRTVQPLVYSGSFHLPERTETRR